MADTAPNLDILDPERTLMSGLGARASALPTFATADTDKVLAKATSAKDPSLLPLMERKAQIADATSQALQIENEGKAVLDQAKTKLQRAASQREAQEYNSLVQNFGEVEKTAPELHPTKENMQSLASMFSLIGLIGTAMGKGPGNYSAMNALKSMTGMMQGWQQGDQARWNREVQEYDKAVTEFKTRLDSAQRKYNMGLQKLATDREAAKADMDMALAELGSPLLKATRDRQGYEAVAKTLNELSKDAAKVYTETGAERRQQQKLGFERGERLAKEKFEVGLEDIRQSNKIKEKLFEEGLKPEEWKELPGVVDKNGNAVIMNKSGETRSLEGITPTKKAGASLGGTAAAMQSTLQQDARNAKYNLESIRDINKKSGTGTLPGGSVAFENKFTGTLTGDIQRYITTQLVDPDNQSIDALLTNLTFDIASGLSGGRGQLSDSKIREVANQMPLDSMPEETKKERWKAIMERVKNINETLPPDRKIEISKDLIDFYGGGASSTSAPKFQEGQKSVSSSGKPIIFKNGQWEYQ